MKKLIIAITLIVLVIPMFSQSKTYDNYLLSDSGEISRGMVSFEFNLDNSFSVYCSDSSHYFKTYGFYFSRQNGTYFWGENELFLTYGENRPMKYHVDYIDNKTIKLTGNFYNDVIILKLRP